MKYSKNKFMNSFIYISLEPKLIGVLNLRLDNNICDELNEKLDEELLFNLEPQLQFDLDDVLIDELNDMNND